MSTYKTRLAILQEQLAEDRGSKGKQYFMIIRLMEERASELQNEIEAKEAEMSNINDEITGLETELSELRSTLMEDRDEQ